MRKLLFVAALLPVATPALADGALPSLNSFYIQAYGGLRLPDNLKYNHEAEDLNIGTTLGGSIGVETSLPGLAADIDYMRSSTAYSDLGTALDSQTLMLDAQYTLDLNKGIKPYAGVGIGLVNLDYKSEDSGNALGYQVKLGATGAITDQLSWFGEYRYQQALGSVKLGNPGYPVEYASHSILGGLKISFGGPSSGGGGGYTGY